MNKKPLGIKIISAAWGLYSVLSIFMAISFASLRMNITYTLLASLTTFIFAWLCYAIYRLKSRARFWTLFFVTLGAINALIRPFQPDSNSAVNLLMACLFCYDLWVIIYLTRPKIRDLFNKTS